MKKLLLSALCASSTMLFAAGIDTESAKLEFEGYKTPEMAVMKGMFTKAQYTFGKDSSSISGQLKGAKAVISPNDVDMGENNEIVTNNVVEAFFKTFNAKRNFTVEFKNVVEANNKGSIHAVLTVGKESTPIPLVYTIEDGKFVAKGRLSLDSFSNGQKALKALSEAAPGHENVSWSVVDVTFSANMK